MLDEGLDLLARLLTGEHVDHRGEHYTVAGAALAPIPVARIPFWIGGNSPRALRRAARFDGWLADGSDEERNRVSPEDVAASLTRIEPRAGFDVAFIGYAEQADVPAYGAAGVTWWVEHVSALRAASTACSSSPGGVRRSNASAASGRAASRRPRATPPRRRAAGPLAAPPRERAA
jgi:hypothetical protein